MVKIRVSFAEDNVGERRLKLGLSRNGFYLCVTFIIWRVLYENLYFNVYYMKTYFFKQNFDFWSFRNVFNILLKNSAFWSNLWFLAKILIFDQNCETTPIEHWIFKVDFSDIFQYFSKKKKDFYIPKFQNKPYCF